LAATVFEAALQCRLGKTPGGIHPTAGPSKSRGCKRLEESGRRRLGYSGA